MHKGDSGGVHPANTRLVGRVFSGEPNVFLHYFICDIITNKQVLYHL